MHTKWKQWLEEADLFIFDMDGTLYENTEHFDYFASQLQLKLPPEKREAFAHEYDKIKTGNHPANVGMVYDVARDAVITVDPMSGTAKAVCDWDGRKWHKEEIRATYPDKLHLTFDTMIAIGDGWWLPQVTARHFGVSSEETVACYHRTKDYMVSREFQVTKTSGLKNGLSHLRQEKKLVLVTNSGQDDVDWLLRDLELEDLFHQIIPSAKKPTSTKELFSELLTQYSAEPHKAVSIGDNFMNEIAPALGLGMKAVYIQPYPYETARHENLIEVNSLADFFSAH